MKAYLLFILVLFCVATPSLFSQTGVTADKPRAATTQPPIPEEARKHFVMGATLFKDAKTHDDFLQVASEFKQAADLAPQWPEARYNLALAREAEGDYAGAMNELKLYQQFKLSDIEARTIQDKIYALDARQQKKTVSDAAAKSAAEAARAKAQEQQFDGKWYTEQDQFIEILGPMSARLSAGFDVIQSGSGIKVKGSNSLRRFQINGRNVQFTVTTDETWRGKGVSQHRHRDRVYDLNISDDGKTLSGTAREENSSADGQMFQDNTQDRRLFRRDSEPTAVNFKGK